MDEKHVFIIGSNGIPANYGGFETFVENLTARKINSHIKYHVACLAKDNNEFEYNNSRCFNVNVPNIGSAKAIYYDLMSLERTIKYIKKNNIKNAIVYVLGTTIGAFIGPYKHRLHKLNIKLYINPDGFEWKRAKWNWLIKKYFKLSERLMSKHADLLICDSVNIEQYMNEKYQKYNLNTIFIPYGSDMQENNIDEKDISDKLKTWYDDNGIKQNEYYLIVGRFVPENNYETMLKEFIKSNTKKNLVIITNIEKNSFYEELKQKTNFDKDSRIKFVGTIYDSALLDNIRKNAFAYLHGHEVGGTNPSLLEALSSTNLNLLLDVNFNKEVAANGALYWNKEDGNLSSLLNSIENMNEEQINFYGTMAKERIQKSYSWEKVVNKYEKIFIES